jgi:hypothetical protein
MTDENLKQTMSKEWQNVRRSFHYPQLPAPKLVSDIPNGSMDMKNLEIMVSEPFIKGFEEKGIPTNETLNEVLTHETTHFMKYPGSVLNILRLQKAGQGIADGNKVSELRSAFAEVQTNLYMTVERKHPATAKMRKSYGLPEEDAFGRLMYGLYQEVSGQDFGVELTRQERDLVGKLKGIDFLDKEDEVNNFRRFAQTLKDYQPKENKKNKGNKGQSNGQGEGEQGEGQSEPCSGSGVEGFTNNQIKEGLKQFAQECNSSEEYEEISKQVLSEGKEQVEGKQGQVMGTRAGSDRGITLLATNFYSALAERYAVPIRKKPMHKNGSLYPHTHTSFEVGDSITEVDAFSTPGILPGITKKWVRKEGEVFSKEESVPDSFIVMDNSPSMFMPDGRTVIPPTSRVYSHLVGATAISNAYLINGSKVAVYSFGSNDHLTNPTENREVVHREIRRFSVDGGTVFNPRLLESVLRQNEGAFDISVVSDMEIRNLDAFVNAVLSIPQTHRVHLLHTKGNQYAAGLRESFGDRENVAILPLTCEKDIYNITIGELKKSVK